ncbi:MAG: LamB/YcsF family protein [Acidimicrobiales bacterium]
MADATVDLNADVGEALGPWRMGDDDRLMPALTTAHVACGFHAGDPAVMRRTVEAAVGAGVTVGAHPSYPDLLGFGRRAMHVEPARVADDVLYQVGALEAIARAAGTRVRSVKPHGALYHRVADDPVYAGAVAGALADLGGDLVLVLPSGSVGLRVAAEHGVAVIAEVFCDRAYLPDGRLARRSDPGSVIADAEVAVRTAVAAVLEGVVTAVDGSKVAVSTGTLCVHGDTPGAAAIARAVRAGLERAGVAVRPARQG